MTTPDAPNDVARQLQPMQIEQDPGLAAPLDPAQQSLAEALRVSFGILKVAMLALLVAAALVGDLVLLPALLTGPLGRFFRPASRSRP